MSTIPAVRSSDRSDTAAWVARAMMGLLFVVSGARKLMYMSATATYFTNTGVPAPGVMVWVVAAFEIIVGALVIIGWRARESAWALAAFTVLTALIGHRFWSADAAQFGNQLTQFLKNLAIAGGLFWLGCTASRRPM